MRPSVPAALLAAALLALVPALAVSALLLLVAGTGLAHAGRRAAR